MHSNLFTNNQLKLSFINLNNIEINYEIILSNYIWILQIYKYKYMKFN